MLNHVKSLAVLLTVIGCMNCVDAFAVYDPDAPGNSGNSTNNGNRTGQPIDFPGQGGGDGGRPIVVVPPVDPPPVTPPGPPPVIPPVVIDPPPVVPPPVVPPVVVPPIVVNPPTVPPVVVNPPRGGGDNSGTLGGHTNPKFTLDQAAQNGLNGLFQEQRPKVDEEKLKIRRRSMAMIAFEIPNMFFDPTYVETGKMIIEDALKEYREQKSFNDASEKEAIIAAALYLIEAGMDENVAQTLKSQEQPNTLKAAIFDVVIQIKKAQ